jgi:glutaredoxin 3
MLFLSLRTFAGATLVFLMPLCSMMDSSWAFLMPVSNGDAGMRTPALGQGSSSNDNNENENDPTKVWYAGLADSIQKVLINSPPLKAAKQALVQSLAGDYDAVAVRAQLDGLIAKHSVFMLSFTTCPFCIKAKSILDAKQAQYHVVECDVDPNGKALRAELGKLLGRTSVPAIFINGTFVGGCNDGGPYGGGGGGGGGGLVQLDKSGELDTMLRAVSAI